MKKQLNINEWIKEVIIESLNKTITLYHGTCEDNAISLIKQGFKPLTQSMGSNMGNPNFLYLSSDPQDALWFAEEKGCDTIIMVNNIPLNYLRPDPEDEAGFTMNDLLDRIDNHDLPSKFILTKELGSKHFTLHKS